MRLYVGRAAVLCMHKELVGSGKMSNRAFHDAMYQEGYVPVEMVRLALYVQKGNRDWADAGRADRPSRAEVPRTCSRGTDCRLRGDIALRAPSRMCRAGARNGPRTPA